MTEPYYFYKQQVLKPEVYQAQMMSKFVQGKFLERGENVAPFVRAQVISFDPVGGMLENPDGSGEADSRNPENNDRYKIKARRGPKNPPRSLRARIITQHRDAATPDEDLRVYWPLFPPSGPDPITLDFVYVFFEDSDRHHGLWVSRVPGPLGEKTNESPGDKPLKEGGDSGQRLASAHGDANQENNYKKEQDVAGTKTDQGSLSGMEYS